MAFLCTFFGNLCFRPKGNSFGASITTSQRQKGASGKGQYGNPGKKGNTQYQECIDPVVDGGTGEIGSDIAEELMDPLFACVFRKGPIPVDGPGNGNSKAEGNGLGQERAGGKELREDKENARVREKASRAGQEEAGKLDEVPCCHEELETNPCLSSLPERGRSGNQECATDW